MVNGCQSRDLAILRMFDEIATRCGRRARLTAAHSDRADRLNPNIVFSKRDAYQWRGHLTVSEVESHRLTLPRTRTALAATAWLSAVYLINLRCAALNRMLITR